MSLTLLQLLKASASGAREVAASSFMRWKTGLSFKRRRIQSEMPSKNTDTRNGMRQPQAVKSSADIERHAAKMTMSERRRPLVAMALIQLVCRPRLPGGACSAT